MATDSRTLLDAVKCYACQTPGTWQLLKLGLLQQILLAQNPMADTSPNALLAAAGCYACYSPGFWQLFELGLLQQIVDGGISGDVQVMSGAADPPVAAPANPALAAIYYAIPGNSVYIWDVAGAAWIPVIT